MKFGPFFRLVETNDNFFWSIFGKQDSVLAESLHGPSVSQNKTPVKIFWFRTFTFQTKESNKIWNLDPFRPLEKNWAIFFGRYRMHDSIVAQTFPGHSMPQNKTPVKVSGSRNLPFTQKKAIKYQIWTLFGHLKQIDQFLFSGGRGVGTHLKSRIQFCSKLCMVLQCHNETALC